MRHTGFQYDGYTPGLSASSYNPDGAAEVFYSIDTIHFLSTLKNLRIADKSNNQDLIQKLAIIGISKLQNLFALQDVLHAIRDKNNPFFALKQKKHFHLFSKSKSDFSILLSEIKNKALVTAIQIRHLNPGEHEALIDILSTKANKEDPRSPNTLKQYYQLIKEGVLSVDMPERTHSHAKPE